MWRYDSFLLRRWQLSAGAMRTEVEHVQSGRQASRAGLAETLLGIGAMTAEGGGDQGPETAPHDNRHPQGRYVMQPMIGEPAPPCTLTGTDGKVYALADFKVGSTWSFTSGRAGDRSAMRRLRI